MNIFILNKRSGIFIILICIILLSALMIGRSNSISVFGKQKELPIYCVDKGEEKTISISFDAAWGNEDTEKLIEILDKYNVKATFFVVGEWVDKYPESVKALSDAGHEIMNHSNTHPHMPKLSDDNIRKEVEECNEKIEKVTGIKPILFRAPYGDYNNNLVSCIKNCGMYCIQWNVDSLDWKDISANEICDRVISKVSPGSIVLFHNAAKNTPEALPKVLDKLQGDGYKIIPISQLILADNYDIDLTGKQKARKSE